MQLFNLPNSLTLLRILLVPVFTYLFLTGKYRIALLVFVFTGLTDVIDGYLARRLKKKTTLGSVLDPAADKLLMFVTFIILAMEGLVPVYLTALVIFRDFWIISGLFALKQLKRKLYFKPTRLSKLNTFFQLLTIFLAFMVAMVRGGNGGILAARFELLDKALQLSIYITAGMTVLSGIQYTRIGLMILRGSREYADLPLEKGQDHRQRFSSREG